MRRFSFRAPTALMLAASVVFGGLAFLPLSASAQDSSTRRQPNNASRTSQAAAQTQNTRPLSDKENPAMIGKRRINRGTDRFFGWLGGSQQRELAIGRQLAMEVEQAARMVEDPLVTEYINRVGQNLVLHSDAKIPFTIKVIDSDEVNAFALPGGFFFINRGLILAADNESELAGVMAHEIAHVAARHAMENQGKLQAINYGLIATIIFGGGIASAVAQNAGGFGQLLSFLKFSRNAEMEADMLGVQYLYAAGYDPTGMATMFEKLNEKNSKRPGTLAQIFSTHPQSLDRRDASLALVARFPEREEYIISTSEFQRVKAHLMRSSNARARILRDGGDDDPGRPTLRRRQPDQSDENADPSTGTSSSTDERPQLRRRDAEPQPSPTP